MKNPVQIKEQWTLAEIRSELARELVGLRHSERHFKHLELGPFQAASNDRFFRDLKQYVIELGHTAFRQLGRESW